MAARSNAVCRRLLAGMWVRILPGTRLFIACDCCMLSGLECDNFAFTFTRGMIRGTLSTLNLVYCLMINAVSCVSPYFLTLLMGFLRTCC